MSIVSEIYSVLNQIAPFQLTMDFDNTGILVGNRFQPVSHCLLALDCTEEIVQQAISSNFPPSETNQRRLCGIPTDSA